MMFLDPIDVYFVTVRTAHDHASSLIHLYFIVSQDRNGYTDRCDDFFSNIFRKSLVIGMDENSDACWQ